VYTPRSHADVILGKILDGFAHDGRDKPGLLLASLYVDQVPAGDLSRGLAARHGVRLCRSIPEALTLGGDTVAVDGVLIVAEHGDYPDNEKGQKLYPRRKFFAAAADVLRRTGKSVPVFVDKHLSATWDDAKWVYDTARELFCPLLAGSTIPLTWRRPKLTLPKGCDLIVAVQLGYGPFEGYGYHALEGLQCMAERRWGGETGVKAVTCLRGAAMWEAMAAGRFSQALLEEAIRLAPAHAAGDYRELSAKAPDAGVILVEYRDGFTAAVAMLNGFLHEGDGGAFCFAGQLKGETGPRSTHFYLQQPEPFAHFGYLVRAFESMVRTGHEPYPPERTLLTTGILDAAMTSRHRGGLRVETPYLEVRYAPRDWPFAADPIPTKDAPRRHGEHGDKK
jgi:hypothetical protein